MCLGLLYLRGGETLPTLSATPLQPPPPQSPVGLRRGKWGRKVLAVGGALVLNI